MKLTDEQFEAILAGTQDEPADLSEDERLQLAEASAVRGRLRAAFSSVTAGERLGERIGAALRAQADGQTARSRKPPRRAIRLSWRLAPIGVAAAALVAVALLFNFTADRAAASPAELARIHNDNLAAGGEFLTTASGTRAAEHLTSRLGFTPRICPTDERTTLIGCSVVEFHGRRTATYLLAVGGRKVSVIVTAETPKEMHLPCGCGCGITDCACYHTGRCGEDNIVSIRLGDYSYNAVGAAPPETLKGILARLRA